MYFYYLFVLFVTNNCLTGQRLSPKVLVELGLAKSTSPLGRVFLRKKKYGVTEFGLVLITFYSR